MSGATNALLSAVYRLLSADAILTGLVSGGIHDRRLAREEMPYLLIGTVETRDLSTDGGDGFELVFSLEAWSAEGRQEAEAIADRVRALLDDAAPALEGAVLVNLRHQRSVSRREARTRFFAVDMRFRAVIEPG